MKDLDKKLSIIQKACVDKQGTNIKVLDISDLTTISDYFVIVSGNSSVQAQAIADEIEGKMLESDYENLSKDGYKGGRWILLDFVDIIVHIFHKEERDYYDLERLWTEGLEEKNI